MAAKAVSKVIAIDGPSGSGKSTVAQLLAERLNVLYIDTGAMFRALAWALKDSGIDFSKAELNQNEEEKVQNRLSNLKFDYAPSKDVLVSINGEDLTNKIREHEVSEMASKISQHPIVRKYLARKQRELAETRMAILEGRDIGTVIFPDAILKIFLTASAEARAQRRYKQLKKKHGGDLELTYDQILADIKTRDERDQNREMAPLKKADDAFEVDTTSMTLDEVTKKIEELYHQQKNKLQ